MKLLQKAVMPARERLWLATGDDLVCGFVVDAADAGWADTPAKLAEVHGLRFPGSPYSLEPDFVDVVRMPVSSATSVIPALGTVAGQTGGPFVDHPPFDPRGFTGGEHATPLWWLDPTRVPAGSELWRVFADGHEELVAAYPHVASGWMAASEYAIARAGWLVPSHVLGTFATWNGQRVLADELPNGKVVVASPTELPGLRAVERGIWAATLEPGDVSDFALVKVTCTWRGLPFQIVRSFDGGLLRLVYVGRDAFAAESLGLEKTDAGVYEATVARNDVADLGGVTVTEAESRPSAAEADRESLVEYGRELFARFTDTQDLKVLDLPDGLGVALVHMVRGGGTFYVAPDRSVLFSSSAQDFEAGLNAFSSGVRTPPEKLLPLSERPAQ